MAGEDIFKALNDLPFRRFALAQMNRADELAFRLGIPALSDQAPGKEEPMMFSCLYGPIGMQATRNTDAGGFYSLAPLVTPGTPYLPRDTNPLTGHDQSFMWTDTNVAAFINWQYTTDPDLDVTVPLIGANESLGDIFDPVIGDHGGAQVWQNFSQAFPDQPRICFELDLYDVKRGRSITNGRIPGEVFIGGAWEFKRSFGPMRWDPDTQIEPRLYITEVKMTPALDTDTAYEAARVGVYLNLCFRGFRTFIPTHPSGAAY